MRKNLHVALGHWRRKKAIRLLHDSRRAAYCSGEHQRGVRLDIEIVIAAVRFFHPDVHAVEIGKHLEVLHCHFPAETRRAIAT